LIIGIVFGTTLSFQSAQEENQQHAAKTTGKVIIFFVDETLDPPRLPSVTPGDKNKRLYTKEDSKGNRVEIWSDSGEYHVDFHRADGKEGRVGKCKYDQGHNAGWGVATVEYELVKKPEKGTPVYPGEVKINKILEWHKIFWLSYEAVGEKPKDKTKPGPASVSNDIFYIYDKDTGKRIWFNTIHGGRWVFDNRYNDWVWERLWMKYVEKHGPEELPSLKDHKQSFYSEPLCEKKEALAYSMHTYIPEYTIMTPLPVTTFVNGTAETYVFKVPYWVRGAAHTGESYSEGVRSFDVFGIRICGLFYGYLAGMSENEDGDVVRYSADDIEIERIEAFVNALFSFDIEMPDEELEIVTYSLVTGPEEMTVDSLTGVIEWVPDHTQGGEHEVVISIAYPGLHPDEAGFILVVAGGSVIPEPQREWAPV
jgi:hypothetical protein